MREASYADLHTSISVAVDRILNKPMFIPYRNCLNCNNWDYSHDICGFYKSKPPTEVIVYGCETYSDNGDIPF